MWHVWGDRRGAYRALVRRPEGERDHLEDVDADWRIILKKIFKNLDGGHELD